MSAKKNFFEQKIKEAHPGMSDCFLYKNWVLTNFYYPDFDPTVKEPKKVGQREWTPTNDSRGAHTGSGYKANVGGGGRAGKLLFKEK